MVSIVRHDNRMEDFRVNNQPKENCGNLTGSYFFDHYGCWWELTKDDGDTVWMIGDYPEKEEEK